MSHSDTYNITTTYYFNKNFNMLEATRFFKEESQKWNLLGLIILGNEGFNFTLCSFQKLDSFKNTIEDKYQTQLPFKDSYSHKKPFRRFSIKERDEIVTLERPDLVPNDINDNSHLTPKEWNQVLKKEDDFVLVDTRNWYETDIGKFKGAVAPPIDRFTEFPEYMAKNHPNKKKKVLIYCTGGVRCEKGRMQLNEMGYDNVYQLKGGILKYLEEFPEDEFEGECFVFDRRVAVKQDLTPTETYTLCPHDGQPATIPIQCVRCGYETLISKQTQSEGGNPAITCSKNCAHHWTERPGQTGPRQVINT